MVEMLRGNDCRGDGSHGGCGGEQFRQKMLIESVGLLLEFLLPFSIVGSYMRNHVTSWGNRLSV